MSFDISWQTILVLCIAAFAAGFVDAIVGGGGLIQLPVALVLLPQIPVVNVIASLKIPSFTGTATAARQYIKKVELDFRLILWFCIAAFACSFIGSQVLSVVSNDFMKPLLLIVLSGVAVYTFIKKDLGQNEHHKPNNRTTLAKGIAVCAVVGFYDGFVGPGAGSFLIFAFVGMLNFDFLSASAYAKTVNLATNLGSIVLFLAKGLIIWQLAAPMAIANAFGSWTGARVALNRGNAFVRKVFLGVVVLILLRFAYDVFLLHRR